MVGFCSNFECRQAAFANTPPIVHSIEINLLDFNQMIYGKAVQVRWYHYLRGEVKFAGADALIAQLKTDEQTVRQYFRVRKD